MVICEECGKKLGIFQGYSHPALGKRFLVCGKCFNKIDKDMQSWSKFCLSDLLSTESSRIELEVAWEKSISNDLQLQKWFNNLWIKKGSQAPLK